MPLERASRSRRAAGRLSYKRRVGEKKRSCELEQTTLNSQSLLDRERERRRGANAITMCNKWLDTHESGGARTLYFWLYMVKGRKILILGIVRKEKRAKFDVYLLHCMLYEKNGRESEREKR